MRPPGRPKDEYRRAQPEGSPASAGFSADWLRLREPFDRAARADADAVLRFALAGRADGAGPWPVVDLGCGTGANLRALAPRLGAGQRWRLVDHDAALLATVPAALAPWAAAHGHRLALHGDTIQLAGDGFDAIIVREHLDLAAGLDALVLPPAALLTASALLDLVSAPWLRALVQRARDARATLLFALSADHRIAWSPPDAGDAAVQALFAAHQQRDKGFGPALGPRAAAFALEHLAATGWMTAHARSDWLIDGTAAPAMLQAMVDGTAAAAAEQDPAAAAAVRAWASRRRPQAPATRLHVGHVDVAARLPA
jgi:SAM-dependent methyltransferase